MPKSNENLQKYTGRVNKNNKKKYTSVRSECSESDFESSLSTIASRHSSRHQVIQDREPSCERAPTLSVYAHARASLPVFVAAGLDWCPAGAVLPSPTGLAKAVSRARGGGPCTYPSWKVRAPKGCFARQLIPSTRGSDGRRHHLFTRHRHPLKRALCP